ncbi:hypothetical protein [Maioricimonas sp. JC845]|uniref:hypothetical protein n=1 Tax=Maioricimonas sp. JC845 TaxID=3232138 RepID=UPI0034592542
MTWAKVQAFWDWEYRDGYTRQGSPSLTQNCYGHALGTGTYVDDGLYGADQIIQDCWTVTSESDAKVAYCHGHAIRVTSEYCNEGEAGMDLITSTSEKYRESPIYTKNGDCNSPATPLKNKFEGTDPPTPIGPYLYYKEDSP